MGRDSGVLKLVEYHLTPDRVRTLFGEAADAELFDDEDYSLDSQVLDAGSLVIMLRTEDRERLVKVAVTYDIATATAATLAQELGETVPRTTRWQHRDATFYAWIRPLLPDEADCDATERRYLE